MNKLKKENLDLQKQMIKFKQADQRATLFSEQLKDLNLKLMGKDQEWKEKISEFEKDWQLKMQTIKD